MTKSPNAFRTISEAAEEVGVPQHVLRFWETKFTFVDPVKRAGGRRFYRPRDIDILKGVRRLLHDEGLTIRGVEKLHKAQGLQRLLGSDTAPLAATAAEPREARREPLAPTARLRALAASLDVARERLDAVLSASS